MQPHGSGEHARGTAKPELVVRPPAEEGDQECGGEEAITDAAAKEYAWPPVWWQRYNAFVEGKPQEKA
jgi:hypothetical protein